MAVHGVRSEEVEAKIALHLDRFLTFFVDAYGHDRASACLRRDVAAQRRALIDSAAATVNNHLASLGGFTAWVAAQAPGLLANGNPSTGLGPAAAGATRPVGGPECARLRTCATACLGSASVGPRWVREPGTAVPIRAHRRPWRDRAIVYLLLSTGLRREELARVDLDQLDPASPDRLRKARRARLSGFGARVGRSAMCSCRRKPGPPWRTTSTSASWRPGRPGAGPVPQFDDRRVAGARWAVVAAGRQPLAGEGRPAARRRGR